MPLPAVSAGAAESEEAQETPDAWDEYTNNTYVQVTDQTSGDYLPSIVLMPGGVFLFTANLYDGMGHVWGYYAPMAGGGLECRVEKRDFAGFIGDDAEAFSIDFIDGQKFTYNGPTIGMTENGDTVLSAQAELPLNDRLAFQGGVSTLIPAEGRSQNGYKHESWDISAGVVFYFRGGACSKPSNLCRPIFAVADNGSFFNRLVRK